MRNPLLKTREPQHTNTLATDPSLRRASVQGDKLESLFTGDAL